MRHRRHPERFPLTYHIDTSSAASSLIELSTDITEDPSSSLNFSSSAEHLGFHCMSSSEATLHYFAIQRTTPIYPSQQGIPQRTRPL
ncbi:hypothetical protein NEUTE1DRAFT_118430 [Neurospora tetrasperma FGSC 2508]|uniref:Uncharacterized protein n=1 Tax=Neurospora tetrasperma (strain FGSC 2508 / ATCC MYA-4615 / P0657) TaxID=510951 RepID=F8MY31_NEUT8|nr:uncharacterized protein NEUTE1DRAFT_118430 [Neurospora tetrasperma FGSC 2508]EGO51513.1 hypothetical protein NEUTE1DRAFT_118430 [Neurospora tetrasperma FGSC 2508]EGZ78501.1 hypothetical protein NEUTE2DRAFT_143232 [Neurospora tetrasperma FGSC 2509]